MITDNKHEMYFEEQLQENKKLLARIAQISSKDFLNFKDKKVLDLACGHGALSIDIALSGAKSVHGIDINGELINFAQNNIKKYKQIQDNVCFSTKTIHEISESEFDVIISKDAFEHIENLETTIEAIKEKLSKNALLIVGFGPLYFSHNGDHGIFSKDFPFKHIMLSEKYLIRQYNNRNDTCLKSVHDFGLNKLKFSDYEKIFRQSGLKTIALEANVSKHLLGKIQTYLRKIPFLKEYFTFNIYAVLQKV